MWKYLEGLVECKVNTKGYTKQFAGVSIVYHYHSIPLSYRKYKRKTQKLSKNDKFRKGVNAEKTTILSHFFVKINKSVAETSVNFAKTPICMNFFVNCLQISRKGSIMPRN